MKREILRWLIKILNRIASQLTFIARFLRFQELDVHIDNIRIVCRFCNQAKGPWHLETFRKYCLGKQKFYYESGQPANMNYGKGFKFRKDLDLAQAEEFLERLKKTKLL